MARRESVAGRATNDVLVVVQRDPCEPYGLHWMDVIDDDVELALAQRRQYLISIRDDEFRGEARRLSYQLGNRRRHELIRHGRPHADPEMSGVPTIQVGDLARHVAKRLPKVPRAGQKERALGGQLHSLR